MEGVWRLVGGASHAHHSEPASQAGAEDQPAEQPPSKHRSATHSDEVWLSLLLNENHGLYSLVQGFHNSSLESATVFKSVPLASIKIVHGFDQISLRSHNSSLESTTDLKFAPLGSY